MSYELQEEISLTRILSLKKENPELRESVQQNAIRWLSRFATIALAESGSWLRPLINVDADGEIVFEWWGRDDHKLIVYIEENNVSFVKVWGDGQPIQVGDYQSLANDGVSDPQIDRELWQWLTSSSAVV